MATIVYLDGWKKKKKDRAVEKQQDSHMREEGSAGMTTLGEQMEKDEGTDLVVIRLMGSFGMDLSTSILISLGTQLLLLLQRQIVDSFITDLPSRRNVNLLANCLILCFANYASVGSFELSEGWRKLPNDCFNEALRANVLIDQR